MGDLTVSFPQPCAEPWGAMEPAGCNRHCAACDTIVHDLAAHTFDQVKELLRRYPGMCARARVDDRGGIILKEERSSQSRRLMVAIGASVTLLTAAGCTAAAPGRGRGVIQGSIGAFDWATRVTATASDGRTFGTAVAKSGQYRVTRLPPGRYTLTFRPSCGASWTVENVDVEESGIAVVNTADSNACVIVGQLRIVDPAVEPPTDLHRQG